MTDAKETLSAKRYARWTDKVQIVNFIGETVAQRLRTAIDRIGGNKAIMAKTGVPSATLQEYLSGREMKLSAAVIFAKECGVNLLWLATGEGPMTGSTGEPQETAPVKAFRDLKVDLMAEALEAARKMFADAKAKPTTRELVQVAFLTYDTLNQQR